MNKQKTKHKKLPKYPSELLKLALDDIAVVKKDKRYKIDTGLWHRPNKKTCSVCLGGAVLASTFKFDRKTLVDSPRELLDEIGQDNCIKLSIIDRLRRLELAEVYYDFRHFLKKLHLTGEEMEPLTNEEMEIIRMRNWSILNKLDKITPRNYEHEDIFCFRSFKKSHEFYSSIVEDIEYLDKKILGMK